MTTVEQRIAALEQIISGTVNPGGIIESLRTDARDALTKTDTDIANMQVKLDRAFEALTQEGKDLRDTMDNYSVNTMEGIKAQFVEINNRATAIENVVTGISTTDIGLLRGIINSISAQDLPQMLQTKQDL